MTNKFAVALSTLLMAGAMATTAAFAGAPVTDPAPADQAAVTTQDASAGAAQQAVTTQEKAAAPAHKTHKAHKPHKAKKSHKNKKHHAKKHAAAKQAQSVEKVEKKM